MTAVEDRPLRADAARNVERILRAAREVYSELGPDAPVEAVARRAGVGERTLYRRFPAKADLVRAGFAVQNRSATTATPVPLGSGISNTSRTPSTAAMRAESQMGFLAAIVESSFDAVIGKTLDGRITSWNAAAQTLFGYSAGEAIGQSITMLIPPENASEESRIMVEIAKRTVAVCDSSKFGRRSLSLRRSMSL